MSSSPITPYLAEIDTKIGNYIDTEKRFRQFFQSHKHKTPQ